LYFVPFLRVLSHDGDEGTLIMGAVRVVEGQLPSRDFFEVMGPGTFYWLGLFFKLLGTTWLATRICLMATTTGLTVLLYHLARRLERGSAALPAVFFVAVSYHSWNAVSHHTDSNLFALASFAALLSVLDRPRRLMLLLAGVGAGVTTWFMLQKGVVLCLAFCLVLWSGRARRSLITMLCGYIGAIVAGVGYFWFAGGLPDLVYANVVWPLRNYTGVNVVPYGWEFRQLYWTAFTSSFGAVFPKWLALSISGFLVFPFLIVMALPLALLLLCIRYRRRVLADAAIPYWIVGIALWISEMHRKDLAHIVFGSPIVIVLMFYLVRLLCAGWMQRACQLALFSAIALAALNPLVAMTARHRIVTRRGVVYDTATPSPILDLVNSRLQPGQPLFVYPYSPMYYFLSAATNPTRYSLLMYGMNTRAQFREVVRDLEMSTARYVVLDTSFPELVNSWFPAYRPPHGEDLIVEPYLRAHYSVVAATEGGYRLLQRREPAPAKEIQRQ
jgi:hypothetical protein